MIIEIIMKIVTLKNNGMIEVKPSTRNCGHTSGILILTFLSMHNFSIRTTTNTTKKPVNIPVDPKKDMFNAVTPSAVVINALVAIKKQIVQSMAFIIGDFILYAFA